jgi:hypothetical protein
MLVSLAAWTSIGESLTLKKQLKFNAVYATCDGSASSNGMQVSPDSVFEAVPGKGI